jgi:DnaJ domain
VRVIAYFALGVAFLLSVLLLAHWVTAADPRALVKGVRYGGAAAAVCIALYLLISGRWPIALAAVSAGLPFFLRWKALRERVRGSAGPSAGRRSQVETAMLRMSLDHETGEVLGSVLKGAFSGQDLDALSRSELAGLLAECRGEDPQSVPLLQSYMERRFGADWDENAQAEDASSESGRADAGGRARGSTVMTKSEALDILGLEEGAGRDQIREAYHRLILKNHPDQGGSAYIAAKLNQAKAVLLGE